MVEQIECFNANIQRFGVAEVKSLLKAGVVVDDTGDVAGAFARAGLLLE